MLVEQAITRVRLVVRAHTVALGRDRAPAARWESMEPRRELVACRVAPASSPTSLVQLLVRHALRVLTRTLLGRPPVSNAPPANSAPATLWSAQLALQVNIPAPVLYRARHAKREKLR
jgi:hypothetical protein